MYVNYYLLNTIIKKDRFLILLIEKTVANVISYFLIKSELQH
jgi:hypothetical protein